jgi:soluble lytic murein transglycosylase-like protein
VTDDRGAPGTASALLFFALPILILAAAVGLRTSGEVESATSICGRLRAYLPAARAAAASEGVPLEILLAVASAESAGHADARSPKGAVGLMQLLPGTAADMAQRGREPEKPVLTDPATSLRLGARYLAWQRRRFAQHPNGGDLALCAYNAGPSKVSRWLNERPIEPGTTDLGSWIPYRETRDYVRRVRFWTGRWTEILADASPRPGSSTPSGSSKEAGN